MSAEPATGAAPCFHCGLPIPPGLDLSARVAGEPRPMCCIGCYAVAEMLEAQGLAGWYDRREGPTGVQPPLVPDVLESLAWLDDESLDGESSHDAAKGSQRETTLLVEGITCAACVWLIERHLEGLAGVASARVNLVTHRLRLAWTPDRVGLRDVIARLAEIGFSARPDRSDAAAELERSENRSALIRLGVSGLGAMNVMTYSVALYAGAFEGMEDGYRDLFRWLSLLVTTPVVLVAARPFMRGALRDLRLRRPGMDVPVALAITGAFVVSTWATLRGGGEVYFDSVCMFTFFLSVGRYFEMRARHRSASLSRRLIAAVPRIARRLEQGIEQVVPAEALRVGDHFVVRPGEALPADGRVLEGRSGVEEALLTGEPWPRTVGPGDEVIAGSVNSSSPLHVEASRVGHETTLAAILALMERAQSEKPAVARLADRVAVVFVSVVLGLALATAIIWGLNAPEQAVWTTLAVLIATCPCALSLATPAALASATHGLAEAGLLVTRGHVLEGLAAADRIVLDKTGTLTRGEPMLSRVVPLRSEMDRDACLCLARSLERDSEHPLARALMRAGVDAAEAPSLTPDDIEAIPGCGVEARRAEARTRIGRPEWVLELVAGEEPAASRAPGPAIRPPGSDDAAIPMADELSHSWVLLADEGGAIAWLAFEDPIREGANQALAELRSLGLALEMLSGDPSPASMELAARLDLEVGQRAATPQQKVERIRTLQARGDRVIVVGDGVNDGPVLAASEISIAMGSGSDLTRLGADAVLMRDDLALLPSAVEWARRTRRVIRQNLAWAIGYNAIALPLALSGQLAPWLAAAGMSASSLVVVLNALRLHRGPEHGRPRGPERASS
ncbi:MAG: heavy metal translocating P-type ATPase [Deltaproteobacteria bacterium]|nr:heavy metal translocating P-type ATPase [Deltaproteobacteria bacterium]